MNDPIEVTKDQAVRKDQGGVFPMPRGSVSLTGTESQIAWAEEIRAAVNLEFDRVANALETRSGSQSDQQRADTVIMITILEEKRAEVMAKEGAGYFIKEWQERGDQVRLAIIADSRCKTISERKKAARLAAVVG